MKMRLVVLAFLLLAPGCKRHLAQTAQSKPPEVVFATPTERSVIEYEEFTGRTESSRWVDVRARVTGYLQKANFKDGANVEQGDILFEIDPRTYQADYDRAVANQALAEAQLARIDSDFQRATTLVKSKAMSAEEFDRITSDRNAAMASLRVAKAGAESSKLNLDFTKVVSPLTGRISRTLIDPGNLVKADDTMLTSIVAMDPIFAYFDVDERTLLRLRRLVQAGRIRSARQSTVNIELGLTDEEGFSQTGMIDFIDNRVVATTGTLRVRGTFANPKGLLSPGLFVRIRMPVGDPRTALTIPEQAISSDQGQRFVYVADDNNVVQYRVVKTGSLQDGFRVIEQGLSVNDRVIVSGLQRVRPGITVDAKSTASPSSVAAATSQLPAPPAKNGS